MGARLAAIFGEPVNFLAVPCRQISDPDLCGLRLLQAKLERWPVERFPAGPKSKGCVGESGTCQHDGIGIACVERSYQPFLAFENVT